MVTIDEFRKLVLSLPGTEEKPHFNRAAFHANKRIFASLLEEKKQVNVMLSPIDQSVFCAFDKTVIYPVPNKWGLQGATTIELTKVKKSMLKDALTMAYNKTLKKKK
jgi:predicted DNA-binding protein (MmcQ/YjbR family)